MQENVWRWFAALDLGAGNNDWEKSLQTLQRENLEYDGLLRPRSDRESVFSREFLNQFRQAIKERLLAADNLHHPLPLSGQQFFYRLGGFVARDEIHPQFAVRAANVIREPQTMGVHVTQFAQDLQESAFVARFAIDDHAIHVEYDCPNCKPRIQALKRALPKSMSYGLVSPNVKTRPNCSTVSGTTDRRDFFTKGICLRILSALIASRLTGFRSRFTGRKSTHTQSPSLAVGSGKASSSTRATPTACF